MDTKKALSKEFSEKPSFVYQTLSAPSMQSSQAPAGSTPLGIPESLKKRAEMKQNEAIIFDEKTKQQTQKMSFFQKLIATLFPIKSSKKPTAGTSAQKKTVTKIDSKSEEQAIREAEKIYREGLATIKDIIAPASMEFMYDKFKLNGI
jgi:hypothetical protein